MLSRLLAVSVVVGLAGFALAGCVSEDGYYGGYYSGGYYGPGPYVYDDYYGPAGGVYYGGYYYRDRRHWRDRDDHWHSGGRDHGRGDQSSNNPPSHHGPGRRYRLVEHPRNDLYPARPQTQSNGAARHGYRLANPDQ